MMSIAVPPNSMSRAAHLRPSCKVSKCMQAVSTLHPKIGQKRYHCLNRVKSNHRYNIYTAIHAKLHQRRESLAMDVISMFARVEVCTCVCMYACLHVYNSLCIALHIFGKGMEWNEVECNGMKWSEGIVKQSVYGWIQVFLMYLCVCMCMCIYV